MSAIKNIHVSDAIMAQLEVAAISQGKTVDEIAEQCLGEALELKLMLDESHAHARARGFKPSDVLSKIAEYRQDKSERGR